MDSRTSWHVADRLSSELRIRAMAFGGFRETLRNYGLELAPILAQAAIPADTLDDDFNWLPLKNYALALTIAARASGDPCFGLKYGTSGRVANPLAYLMGSAPDLRTALKSFVRYQPVINTNVAELVESDGLARFQWSYPVTMTNVIQLTDLVLMRFICRIQSAAGLSWRPLSVGVTHHHPTDPEAYERRLGPRISFNQPNNDILIAGPTLGLPMPQTDPQLFKLLIRFCEQQIERDKSEDDPLNQIRDAMLSCLQQGSVSPKRVAGELDVLPARLHRHLKVQGTTFERLYDDTRRRLAHRYLYESSLKLTDIASRLGYSELSAFSRAAKRWFGASPRSIRRQLPNLDKTV